MKNNKLIHFLRLLPQKDLQKFDKYIHSPFFNEREAVRRLYKTLEKEFTKKNSEFDPEEIYRSVYGDRAFNEASLKTCMSQLFSLLRDYLAYSKFKEKETLQNRLVIEKLNDLEENKYFKQLYRKSISELEKTNLDLAYTYHERMLMEEEYNLFLKRQVKRSKMLEEQSPVQFLTFSFLAKTLRYKLNEINIQSSFRVPEESDLSAYAIKYIQRNLEQMPLGIQIYIGFYEAFLDPMNLHLFEQAKELLSTSVEKISRLEVQELYIGALNFCARHINDGDEIFLRPIYDIYQEMLQLGILQQKGKISPFHCKNIVSIALRLGEFQWTSRFLDEWQNKVSGHNPQTTINYNQGLLKFYQASFHEAAQYFNKVLAGKPDVFYGLNARGFLLKIYYEISDIRSLESQAHSYRMYIHRTKQLSDHKRNQYIEFINHLNRLINAPSLDQKRLQKLRSDIVLKPFPGMGTSWLLEKIDELSGA